MLPLLFLLPPIYGFKVLELLPGFFVLAVRFPSVLWGRYALSISSLPLWGFASALDAVLGGLSLAAPIPGYLHLSPGAGDREWQFAD